MDESRDFVSNTLRFTVGQSSDGRFLIIDRLGGWVKGWYDSRSEAEEAARDAEAGRELPPEAQQRGHN